MNHRQKVLGASYSGAVFLLVFLLVSLPFFAGPYFIHMFVLTFFSVGLAISYRLVLIAGEVSLAHASFYGIGAYGFSILAISHGVPFWLAVLLGGLLTGLVSLAVGFVSLRTTGPYFFLVTFAFGVVITAAIELTPSLTGGFGGVTGIPFPPFVSDATGFYFVLLTLTVLTFLVFRVLDNSRFGLELRAIGSAPLLAESAGVNRFQSVLVAFVIGAFFAGILGSLYASFTGFISPGSFGLNVSIAVLTAVIIGGVRYMWGGIIGASFILIVPLATSWGGRGQAIFGATSVIIVMMLLRRGIVTSMSECLVRWTQREPKSAMDTPQATVQLPDSSVQETPRPDLGDVILDVHDLSKSFGGVHAVKSISFQARSGETLGVIGPNGSGKTTMFSMISGFLPPDRGTVTIGGDLVPLRRGPSIVARRRLVRSFQSSAVFEDLTVFENVLFAVGGRRRALGAARFVGSVRSNRRDSHEAMEILREVGLADQSSVGANHLPYGHKKVLGLAIALASEPQVLCLDEPATGMTESEISHLIAVLRRVRSQRGLTLIVIEHRLSVIRQLCDRVIALRQGELLAEGSVTEVLETPEVMKTFLGKAQLK